MILLRNCFYILNDNNRNLSSFDILVKENIIDKIARNINPDCYEKPLTIIDCSHCVVVPGFVNLHHHFYQTLTRNLSAVQNAKLFDWLVYLYEIWKNIDAEAVYYSSLLAAGELLKTGCTCTSDHHYLYPKGFSGDLTGIQFEAAKNLGIRFSPSRGSMSLSRKDGGLPPDSVVQTEDKILKESIRAIETYHDPGLFSMNRVVLAPCSPFSVTPDLMIKSAEIARTYNVKLHTHLAETKDENDFCLASFGKRPLKLMEDCNFLGKDVWFAHGIHFNDDELKTLAQTKTAVCHCPSSNMRLGSGVARVRDMLDMGIRVGLGVDGSASNDTSDMLGELRNAMLLQRVKYGPSALTAEDSFNLATVNGADILGFENIGKIKEGWAADLAVFNINKLEYAGSLSDPLAALIFAGFNHGTEYTIVNGRIVVNKGRLTGFNEEEIITKANIISKKLLNS